jgi:hypothetical protein
VVGKVVSSVPEEGDSRGGSSCTVDSPVSLVHESPCETCERVVAMSAPWPTTDDGGDAKLSCNQVYPLCERASDSGLLELLFFNSERLSAWR